MTKSLDLYQVLSNVGRALVGTFGSKAAARNAMRKINASRKAGEPPVFVSPGPDHWRYKTDRTVPLRGPEYRWEVVNGEPALVVVPW